MVLEPLSLKSLGRCRTFIWWSPEAVSTRSGRLGHILSPRGRAELPSHHEVGEVVEHHGQVVPAPAGTFGKMKSACQSWLRAAVLFVNSSTLLAI